MTSFAGRRRRRRRAAAVTGVCLLVAVLGVVTGLWRRSVLHQRRAEAQKLIMMGNVESESYPTATLAYATSSLELADSEDARLLALEALWRGPAAFVVNNDSTRWVKFSPDGRWLVQTRDNLSSLAIISRDGQQQLLDCPTVSGTTRCFAHFGGSSELFFAWGSASDFGRIALGSAPEHRLLTTATVFDSELFAFPFGVNRERQRAIVVFGAEDRVTVEALDPASGHERLGALDIDFRGEGGLCMPVASAAWLGVVEGNDVSVIGIGARGLSDRRLLGQHEGDLTTTCSADPLGRFLVTWTRDGEIRLWDVSGNVAPTAAEGPPEIEELWFSNDGSLVWAAAPSMEDDFHELWIWSREGLSLTLRRVLDCTGYSWPNLRSTGPKLAMRGPGDSTSRVWTLGLPEGSEPLLLERGGTINTYDPALSPDGKWAATGDGNGLAMWPLTRPHAANLEDAGGAMAFGPEGRFLVIAPEGRVTLVPLEGAIPAARHSVFESGFPWHLAVSPSGEYFALSGPRTIAVGRDDGTRPRLIEAAERHGFLWPTFSRDSRYLAALNGANDLKIAVFRVWEVSSGREVAVLDLPDHEMRSGSGFADDGRLLVGTSKGVVAWDFVTGDHEVLVEIDVGGFAASADGRRLVVVEMGEGGLNQDPADCPIFFDLDAGATTRLESHGKRVWTIALSRDGMVVVTADRDGIIRVGPVTGEEPHLLLRGSATEMAIDPLGRWVATPGRLWPMPDLSEPPLHTLPRRELIAKLKTQTNVRVVRDPDSSTGWKLTHEPFAGWETAPTW
jgi:WD40 repeat protein